MSVRLFVGGLSFSTSSEGLRDAFARFGPVQSAAVMTDRETGRSRGFGFVEMAGEEEAERALEAMCARVQLRVAFGKPLAEQGTIRADIADSRIEIDQARLLVLNAAHRMDILGNKAARTEIAMIKVVAPSMALRVIDRAIQAHGAAGVSEDFGLAAAWADARTLRFADGPDEVHRGAIAKWELRKTVAAKAADTV